MSFLSDALFQGLTSRLKGSRDAAVRFAQSRGLAGAAKVARIWLDASGPRDDSWLDWEYCVVDRLLSRMCRYPGDDLPRPADTSALETTLEFASTLPASRRRQLRDLVAVFEAGAMVFGPDGEFVRFTELSGPAADRYLELWSQGPPPLRGGFHALKSICMMGFWSRPDTWDAIGYSLSDNPGLDH